MKCHSSPSAPARSLRAAGLLTAAGLALTACGGDGDDGQVELSFVWWGSDARHQNTQEIIDAFEAEHPDISINPTFSEWDGYWDTLATQTAGGDSPDIIQMDELYLREYADRGALLDLTEVDLSNFEDTVVESGQTEEGQFGVTIGINAATLLANPDLFEEAGVEIPDDEPWTWEDYHQTASELSEGLEDAWGSGNFDETLGFQAWTRQHGEGGELLPVLPGHDAGRGRPVSLRHVRGSGGQPGPVHDHHRSGGHAPLVVQPGGGADGILWCGAAAAAHADCHR